MHIEPKVLLYTVRVLNRNVWCSTIICGSSLLTTLGRLWENNYKSPIRHNPNKATTNTQSVVVLLILLLLSIQALPGSRLRPSLILVGAQDKCNVSLWLLAEPNSLNRLCKYPSLSDTGNYGDVVTLQFDTYIAHKSIFLSSIGRHTPLVATTIGVGFYCLQIRITVHLRRVIVSWPHSPGRTRYRQL